MLQGPCPERMGKYEVRQLLPPVSARSAPCPSMSHFCAWFPPACLSVGESCDDMDEVCSNTSVVLDGFGGRRMSFFLGLEIKIKSQGPQSGAECKCHSVCQTVKMFRETQAKGTGWGQLGKKKRNLFRGLIPPNWVLSHQEGTDGNSCCWDLHPHPPSVAGGHGDALPWFVLHRSVENSEE